MLAAQNTPNKRAEQLSKVAVKLFFAITGHNGWKLTKDQQISLAGLNSRTTLHTWEKNLESGKKFKLGRDTLERLSLIAGIRKGIEILSPQKEWDSYPHRANRVFNGQSAIERMLQGNMGDLYDVRRYLDAERGAHHG